MTRAAHSAPMLIGALWSAGLGGLALITLVSPGATRMYAWPWTLALAATLIAPVVLLVLRAFDPRTPLALPARPWMIAVVFAAVAILMSALASPYRGPSLHGSAPLLGGLAFFLVMFDWLHRDPAGAGERRTRLLPLLTAFLMLVAATSLAMWFAWQPPLGLAEALAIRNAYPLGHSNYTAGLALLLLACAIGLVRRGDQASRMTGLLGTLLGLVLLFTSGSRAGVIGLATLAVAGLLAAPMAPKKKLLLALALIAAGAVFTVANPRTRAFFTPSDPAAAPNVSNVQRAAMIESGLAMGDARPLLGWGPGATPMAYPLFRAGRDGGVENALQLHSTPVQIWAELGAMGLLAALAFVGLIMSRARSHVVGFVALVGYGIFAFFDWQLDVPVFGFVLATLAALLAPPRVVPASVVSARALGGFALAGLALVMAFGHRDFSPELNARALALTVERTAEKDAPAIVLLRESLALNPDQEIAHFNLGWLLVIADPIAAERHFRAAARLVPDKGGVYFGLGLALLNQARSDLAARAFALEGLNDPAFLASPYWREPAIAAMREATAANLSTLAKRAQVNRRLENAWVSAQLERVAKIEPGRVPEGPERAYRRERPGYPVLMRNPDLGAPLDVFVVREIVTPPDPAAPPLPPKGWLPSPIFVRLLDETLPTDANRAAKIENRK